MKLLIKIFFLVACMVVLSMCKKYPDGGLINETRLHLFGGHKNGSSKTWKLKLYEVNGIDSTNLILGASSVPNFYEKFVTFKLTNKKEDKYEANTFTYSYYGQIDVSTKQITIGNSHPSFNHVDSTQCKIIDGINYCARSILFPELDYYGKLWNIKKLTKHELIIETNINLKNSYKIIFTY